MYKEKLRESFKVYDEIVLKCFCGIFIGAIVAVCEVVFGKGLECVKIEKRNAELSEILSGYERNFILEGNKKKGIVTVQKS